MEHSPEPRENTSRFEKLLAALAADGVDFAVVGGLVISEDLIFLKEGSWREKDKFDVQAMREIIAREGR